MALSGELAKYIGNEMVKTGGKELAKAGARSALSSLVPSVATKAVASMANKSVLNSLVPTATRKLASGIELGTDMIPMFRGQTNTLDKLDYNKGLSPNSNGFFMTPNKSATDSWAGKGVVSVDADPNDIMTLDELRSLKKSAEKYFRDPKYQMELYNTNPTQAEIYDALEAGDSYQELSRLTKKPFIERDGGQGTELGEVVFFPDTKPELTSRYNADLASGKNQWLAPTEDVVASETAVPAGTKIKFDKDLNIKDIEKPNRGRGWYADNETNPHISQVVKQNGLDKYLGEPKINYSLAEEPDMVTIYHNTKAENIPSILEQGLIPGKRPGGYLASPEEAGIWTDDRGLKSGSYGGTTVKIRVPKKEFDATRVNDTQNLLNRAIKPSEIEGVDYMLFDTPLIKNSNLQEYIDKYGEDKVRNLIEKKGLVSPEVIEEAFSGLGGSVPKVHQSKNGEPLTDIANRIKAMNKSGEMSSNIKRIGSSGVAKIDKDTLPAGYDIVKKYLGKSPADITKEIEDIIGVALDDPSAGDKLAKFVEDEGYDVSKNIIDNLNTARQILDERTLDELNMEGAQKYAQFIQTRGALAKDNPSRGVGPRTFTISADDDVLSQTDAAKLDKEYSDRLGIGRSHTPMNDKTLSSDAKGYYMGGGIGINPLHARGETGVSTIAHERMHAWQDINSGSWDSRVGEAIDELRNELKKFYHTKDQIKAYRKSGYDLDYYANDKEQEARMLQSYLDNEGFTDTYHKNDSRGVEWGDEIKPAFDKFFKKLRALSKKGIALPAIAGLVGIGAMSGGKDEKTLTI